MFQCIMQILYDIHTHKKSNLSQIGYRTISIINTYPLTADIKTKEDVYYSCGIHPWYLEHPEEQLARLREIVREDKVVAVGEAGLDKLKGADWKIQIDYFRKQIELAQEVDKPLIIHCVRAWNELLTLHKEYKPVNSWIIHGFRGKPQLADQLISQGIKISLGHSFNLQVLKIVPLESIFCETDDTDSSVLSICNDISSYCGISVTNILSIIQNSVIDTFKL